MKPTLTVGQLKLAGSQNNYLAFRHISGRVVGINSKVMFCKRYNHYEHDYMTDYIGLYPINFSEYIRIKIPYYIKK